MRLTSMSASCARYRPQVGDLLSVPLGTYFDVAEGVLPEATHEYYKDPVLKVR